MAYTGVALLQNINALPFTNERLAASVGKSTAEFNAAPVSEAAVNVVFDALAESKTGPVSKSRAHQGSTRTAPSRLHQRQRMPQAAPSFGQPRPIRLLGRTGRPYRLLPP